MTIAADWFRDWFDSPYYHRLYFERDEKEAAGFIGRLLDHLQPPPASLMLDVACGRGRHARILAEKGFDTTGIDLAAGSIAWASRYESEHLHFYQHDMRMPFWIHYFDYAFNFFTSFGYFRTEREHANALRSISQSLRSKGVFVIDYLNAQYAEDRLVGESQKKIGDTIYHLTKWCDDRHFYKKIVIEDPKLEAPLTFGEKIAKFSLSDLTGLLAAQGLQTKETFGDYSLAPYDPDHSPRMVLVARKGG
jgi:SAM-dependent methyltransferase